MFPILSFVRKDLRLLFWPWLGWVGLMMGKFALAGWYLTADKVDDGEAMRWNVGIAGLSALLAGVLVAKLVQADAPCRLNAFWRSRPISGGGLLVAKATTAFVLFGLAPVLIALPWWLFNGRSGVDVAWGAAEMMVLHACVLAPSFLIAAVVDTMGRAVLWSFVQCAVQIGIQALNVYAPATSVGKDMEPSRFVLAVLIGAVGVAALIVWQYTRRQTVAVVTCLVILHGLVQATWMFSPYDFSVRVGGWTELHPELGRGITLQPANKVEFYSARHTGPGPAPVQVKSLWPITGVSDGLQVNPQLMSLEMSGVDGYLGRVANSYAGSWDYQLMRLKLGMKSRLSNFWPGDLAPNQFPVFVGFSLTPEEADRVKAVPPSVAVGLRVSLERSEVLYNRPLREGDWHVDQYGGLKIVRAEPEASGSLHIVYVHSDPRPLLRTFVEQWRTGMLEPGSIWTVRPTRDVVFQADGEELQFLEARMFELRIFGVGMKRNQRTFLTYAARSAPHATPIDETEKWGAGLRLARVVNHEQARFFLRGHTEALVVENERSR